MFQPTQHPLYAAQIADWEKFRDVFVGGQAFVSKYLARLSRLESNEDFQARLASAYCPGFAAAAIDSIAVSIFERLPDVTRVGGVDTYQSAVKGEIGGVDLQDATMSTFMGTEVLPELLALGKVGVLVDNERDLGSTLADKGTKHPFVTVYTAENILNWAPRVPTNGFTSILLREYYDKTDDAGLAIAVGVRYRLMQKVSGGVRVVLYDDTGAIQNEVILELETIPFICSELKHSLLRDAADYQIALLQIESADIGFIRKANYPLYYEFIDPKTEGRNKKQPGQATEPQARVGLSHGRQFPAGFDPPGFVGPPPEILAISMQKGEAIKADIRRLVNLNLASVGRDTSDGAEAGLGRISTLLCRCETGIAQLWARFESRDKVETTIEYPKTFKLKTDAERVSEAKSLDELTDMIPSNTFRRKVRQQIARGVLSGQVTEETLQQIEKEIDDANVVSSDPNIVLSAQKSGLLDDISAADALGFDGKKTVPLAKQDRAERIRLTQEAQGGLGNASPARGATEFDKGQPTSADEKDGKAKRGKADNTNLGTEIK